MMMTGEQKDARQKVRKKDARQKSTSYPGKYTLKDTPIYDAIKGYNIIQAIGRQSTYDLKQIPRAISYAEFGHHVYRYTDFNWPLRK